MKRLVPEDIADRYLLDIGDETDGLDLTLGLPAGATKKIIKRIQVQTDDDEEESV